MSEELKPCPFCGGAGHITGPDDGCLFVHCLGPDCHCAVGENYDGDAMPKHAFYDPETATAAWNTRLQAERDQGGEYYHDVHCSALRNNPMGEGGCSCSMYQRATKVEAERDRLLELVREYRSAHYALREERFNWCAHNVYGCCDLCKRTDAAIAEAQKG